MPVLEPGTAFLEWAKKRGDIMAMVGGNQSPRIHPVILPQSSLLPAIVYQIVSTTSDGHLRGIGALAHSRLRIRCYAANRSDAFTLSEFIRHPLVFEGGRRPWGELFINGVSIESGPFDDFDLPRDASDEWRLYIVTDYLVSWRQPRTYN